MSRSSYVPHGRTIIYAHKTAKMPCSHGTLRPAWWKCRTITLCISYSSRVASLQQVATVLPLMIELHCLAHTNCIYSQGSCYVSIACLSANKIASIAVDVRQTREISVEEYSSVRGIAELRRLYSLFCCVSIGWVLIPLHELLRMRLNVAF